MEAEFIRWLRERLPRNPAWPLGISDDAALVTLTDQSRIVVTTDLLTEGVDFQLAKDDPRLIGRKALATNFSDLAAMAAKPLAAFVSVALPRAGVEALSALELAKLLYQDLLPLAAEFDCALAGGDTNTYDGPLVISVTALGTITARGPLTRSGGQVGDKLLVTGSLGGSILGHSFSFTPRVREALLLHERYELHAGMDISDGLALDLSRLAAESRCGAVVHTDQIPISDSARNLVSRESNEHIADAALRHALGDGEDFELLLAVPSAAAAEILRDKPLDCPVTCVGELIAERGLFQQSQGTERLPLEPIGWQH
jgi:thiamine-monophosphate kinase